MASAAVCSKVLVLFIIVAPIVCGGGGGGCVGGPCLHFNAVRSFLSSFAVISLMKRELVSYCCHVLLIFRVSSSRCCGLVCSV